MFSVSWKARRIFVNVNGSGNDGLDGHMDVLIQGLQIVFSTIVIFLFILVVIFFFVVFNFLVFLGLELVDFLGLYLDFLDIFGQFLDDINVDVFRLRLARDDGLWRLFLFNFFFGLLCFGGLVIVFIRIIFIRFELVFVGIFRQYFLNFKLYT